MVLIFRLYTHDYLISLDLLGLSREVLVAQVAQVAQEVRYNQLGQSTPFCLLIR